MVSVDGILRKEGKNYKGLRDKVAFTLLFFSKSKKVYEQNPFPTLSFKVLLKSNKKLISPF